MTTKGMYSSILNLSEKNSYLVPNQDLRGVGVPYVKASGFLDASEAIDPAVLAGAGIQLAMIPSPIVGKYIHLPDGNVSAPGLAWQGEITSGRYRIGSANAAESILGSRVFDWNATQISYANAYRIQQGSSTAAFLAASASSLELHTGVTTVAGALRWALRNSNSGTSAHSTISCVSNEGNDCSIGITSSGFTPTTLTTGEGFLIMNSGNGGGPGGRPLYILNALNSYLRFGTNNTEWMRLTAGGALAINSTNPGRRLDVTDTIPQFRISYTSGVKFTDIETDSSGNLKISPSNSTATPNVTAYTPQGLDFYLSVTNDANTINAYAVLQAKVAGSTAQDPYTQYVITGATTWSIGADNSDGDTFKISKNATLGTNDYLTITTAGVTTISSLALSGFTSGSVLFAGSSGAVTQDNANFFWDDASNFLRLFSTSGKQARIGNSSSVYFDLNMTSQGDVNLSWVGGTKGALQWTGGLVGSPMKFLLTNSDATDTNSSASIQIVTTHTTASPWINLTNGTTSWNLTQRGTSSNTFCIGTSSDFITITTLGKVGIGTAGPDRLLDVLDTAAPQMRLTYTDGSIYTDYQTDSAGDCYITPSGTQIRFDKSGAGVGLFISMKNQSNTASSDAAFFAAVGGTSAGDATMNFKVTGGTTWTIGVDNSDSDSFKINPAGALGTTDSLTILTGGNVGINTTGPDRKLDILDTSMQLRLTYTDGSVYTDIGTDSSGNLNVTASSGEVQLGTASNRRATFVNGVTTLRFDDNALVTNLTLTNVDGTATGRGSSILFRSGDNSSIISSARIDAITEGAWTSTASTQDASLVFWTALNGTLTEAFRIDSNQILNPRVTLATTMTRGFINIPGAAGVPSGTPATTTGFPLYWDSTNLQLYVYTGGAWKKSAVFT